MITKILAALDGTRDSASILPYLKSLLQATQAECTLVSVVPPGQHERARAREGYLKELIQWLGNRRRKINFAVLLGQPAEEILKYAYAGFYDLVALCSHGRKGIERLMLGSVAEEVIRRSTPPVLVVHPTMNEVPPGRLRKILVPLDGSHRSSVILPYVAALARGNDARLVLLRVVPAPAKTGIPSKVAVHELFRTHRELQKQGLKADVHVVHGDPAREIPAFARSQRVDLVALATHGRSGLERARFGSVAESILRGSPFPMLVIRSEAVVREHPPGPRAVDARRRSLEQAAQMGRAARPAYSNLSP